jgi:hypothetical protein
VLRLVRGLASALADPGHGLPSSPGLSASRIRQMIAGMKGGSEVQPYGSQGMLDEPALLPIGLNQAPGWRSMAANGWSSSQYRGPQFRMGNPGQEGSA